MKSGASDFSQLSDEELMKMFKMGTVEAFDTLYQRHSPRVYGYLKKRIDNEDLTLDILQETFLKLHRYRKFFDAQKKFLPWLFTLSRTAMIDTLRTQQIIDARHQFVDLDQLPSSEQPERESSPRLPELLSSLSPREQEVLSLRYHDDLQFASIAEKMRLSLINVRKIASRALKHLRSEVK